MEDILASIRRILSEDEAQGGAQAGAQTAATPTPEPVPPPPPAATEPAAAAAPPTAHAASPHLAPPEKVLADDVLVLDSSMLVQPEPAPARPPAPMAELDREIEPSSAPISAGLLAPATAAAAASSVNELVRRLAVERSTAVHRGGPTIEDLVREEIRPLLKAWLDEHLPGLVDRAVRAEIERVVGRAMS